MDTFSNKTIEMKRASKNLSAIFSKNEVRSMVYSPGLSAFPKAKCRGVRPRTSVAVIVIMLSSVSTRSASSVAP